MATIEAPRMFPALRYRDASAAIDFLQRAFGFALHAKYMEGDKVAHAQMSFGSSMLMLGDARDEKAASGQNGGMGVYIAVDDPDALCRRAEAAGAAILQPPTDQSYGSREFSCADPEGHRWSFGTYWPKADEPPAH